jgi:hypothetical protein
MLINKAWQMQELNVHESIRQHLFTLSIIYMAIKHSY